MDDTPRTALVLALRNVVEHNPAVVYKTVFLGETVDLVERRPGWRCETIDFDIDDVSLTALTARLLARPEAILLWAEAHHARLAIQIGDLVRKISPDSPILVFGRGATFLPQLFGAAPFHAAHAYGDREATVTAFLDNIEAPAGPVIGTVAIDGNGAVSRTPGRWLTPEAWPLPALDRLPLDRYRAFTERVHGPEYSKRISVTVSKGCGLGCAYCGATEQEGRTDRRRDLEVLFNWFERAEVARRDSLIHLYASDLFADPAWIAAFSETYRARSSGFGWRGVTTTRTLQDEATVRAAGLNGCRELAVGIEHVSADRHSSVKSTLAEIERAAALTRRYGITLKGLVMIGYPGQKERDIEYLEDLADDWRITLRYTGYTPLHRLRGLSRETLLGMNLEQYDRRTFFDPEATTINPAFFFGRLTTDGGYHRPPPRDAAGEAVAA